MLSKRETSILTVAKSKRVERLKKNGNMFDNLVEKGFLTPSGRITETGRVALTVKPKELKAA